MGQILHFIRPDTIAFDDHATHAMGEAFDAACAELQDNHLSELVREMIAERIIDAATRGERDPKRLCRKSYCRNKLRGRFSWFFARLDILSVIPLALVIALLPPFLFRCPNTRQTVQGFFAEEVPNDAYNPSHVLRAGRSISSIQQQARCSGPMKNRPPSARRRGTVLIRSAALWCDPCLTRLAKSLGQSNTSSRFGEDDCPCFSGPLLSQCDGAAFQKSLSKILLKPKRCRSQPRSVFPR